ncbi:TonB-dependent receptor domain-containing protein [Brevundimonas intermedia]|uniref:TonB-dependent receptor n=1 Tax=Brevundimonas intermedia TaxID=74315 RepID=UPI0022F26997|nr:TonB-dependent receptor [Brevundimonas intermedia]
MNIRSIRRTLLSGTIISSLTAAVGVLAPVLATPTPAMAQDISSGTLTGSVVGEGGAPVVGATVEIQSTEQGFSRSATTDAEGDFRAALLPIGRYKVTITAPGYAPVAQSVQIALGGTSSYSFSLTEGSADTVGEIVVTAARRNLDFNETTTGLTVDVEDLVKTTPVGRSISSIILLAPGTVAGDSTFGDVPSIGGSSVAENAYYINGLNITNFDNYIGASTVPFDFYRSVEVKTGGYAAEFGRATGGIVNAVTKSGSNDLYIALHGNYAPDSLRSQSPDTYASANSLYEADSSSTTLELGGPIIKDRLFFYGLTEFRDTEASSYSITGGTKTTSASDDPFYGVKLDGYVTDDHHLEFTWFDTTRETNYDIYNWDSETGAVGDLANTSYAKSGGESFVARYTGTLTDWLTVSAAYGKNKDSAVSTSGDVTAPYAYDFRLNDAGTAYIGRVSEQTSSSYTPVRETEREFWRFDADLYFDLFGKHHLRAGIDHENLSLARETRRTGGQRFYYYTATSATSQAQGGNLSPGQTYVAVSSYSAGGTFENENEAYYLQDSWDVNEQLTLNLGIRLDKFNLNGATGETISSFDEEIGPRLGFTFDPLNDGRSRFYGSYGRYYLPIASNTAYRMASSELSITEYFLVDQTTPYDENGVPNLGEQIVGYSSAAACPAGGIGTVGVSGCTVTADGSAPSTESLVAKNLESTAEDEFQFGYERKIGDLWTVGANYTYRNLLRNAEDVAIDLAVVNYCEEQGISGCGSIWSGFHQYVIVNPGAASTITLSDPLPGETEVRTIEFSAEDLGYPKAKRIYQSLELTFDRAFDGIWSLRGSYVLSKSEGNTEGYVKSDNGQTDAGITQDFDQPGLTDGAYGLLPNHRAHVLKLFGSYQVLRDLTVGGNLTVASPRHYGCIGYYPDANNPAYDYGASSYYCNGEATPRGSQMTSDWQTTFDVSLRYTVPVSMPGDLVLRADIFNLFDLDAVSDLYEFGDLNGPDGADLYYGQPTSYQSPRYVRVGFDWTF